MNKTIIYRGLNEGDKTLLREWSNDPVTRLNSFNSAIIGDEDHNNWFKRKLINKDAFYLVAVIDDVPGAVLRYDIMSDHSLVGINIAPQFRGYGLSSKLLKETAELYFQNFVFPLIALIKSENVASVKSFEKAGYKMLKEEIINGFRAFRYQLEKS